MARLLVLTTDPPPIAEVPATGAGMRAWGLAEGLRSAGAGDVDLAFAADARRGTQLALPPNVHCVERAALDDFIAGHRPDAVIFQHWGLFGALRRDPGCPVAMDLAGPHLLERLLWDSPKPAQDLAEKLAALARADFTVCSGEFQRHWFLGFLAQAGHDMRNNALCPVIPFSLSPQLPAPRPERARDRVLFAGMFLPWQDPEPTLRAALETMDEKGRGSLLFLGGPHPAGDVSGGRFDALLAYLRSHERVEMRATMPFPQLVEAMLQCGLAIDVMPRNAERELAFPTRTITYLWSGLPVIHNDFDELAVPIEAQKAGWTCAPDDPAALKERLSRLLSHHEDIPKRSENAQALVRERYTWDRTIGPLAAWCADPKRREGRRPVNVNVAGPAPAAPRTARRGRRPPSGRVSYAPAKRRSAMENGPWYLSPLVFALALPISLFFVLLFCGAELLRMALGGNRGG